MKYFELGNATEAAIIAGYSSKTARSMAAQNLTKLNISARLQELRQIVEDATIADVKERKQILSEIVRGRVTDFVECGADGSYINIGLESCNSHAIQEVTSTTKYDDKGADAAVITRLKLNSPVQAISELNKMERIYEAEGTVKIDNRVLNIYVNSDKAKDLTQRLIEGERTIGHNDH